MVDNVNDTVEDDTKEEDNMDYGYAMSSTKAHHIQIPNSYKEALNSPQADNWKEAIENQINKLKAKKMWTLVHQPQNVRLLPGKWVYDLKTDAADFITTF